MCELLELVMFGLLSGLLLALLRSLLEGVASSLIGSNIGLSSLEGVGGGSDLE